MQILAPVSNENVSPLDESEKKKIEDALESIFEQSKKMEDYSIEIVKLNSLPGSKKRKQREQFEHASKNKIQKIENDKDFIEQCSVKFNIPKTNIIRGADGKIKAFFTKTSIICKN